MDDDLFPRLDSGIVQQGAQLKRRPDLPSLVIGQELLREQVKTSRDVTRPLITEVIRLTGPFAVGPAPTYNRQTLGRFRGSLQPGRDSDMDSDSTVRHEAITHDPARHSTLAHAELDRSASSALGDFNASQWKGNVIRPINPRVLIAVFQGARVRNLEKLDIKAITAWIPNL